MTNEATTDRPAKAVLSLKIEPEKLEQLSEIAARDHRKRSQLVRLLIDRCIADHEEAA